MDFFTQNIFLIIVALVSGGLLLWPLVQRALGGASVIGPLQATRLINDGAVVVDVREPNEYATGHIRSSRNIPVGQIANRAAELPADKPVILLCASGARAQRAAATLRKEGRQQVFCLEGGVSGWQQAGQALSKS